MGKRRFGGFATFIDYPDMLNHPDSIGWPIQHLQMSILDPDGNQLPPGVEGEICFQGPSVMLGYWRNEPATNAALGHGWLRTGDLGKMDDLGLGYLYGRSKELIKNRRGKCLSSRNRRSFSIYGRSRRCGLLWGA